MSDDNLPELLLAAAGSLDKAGGPFSLGIIRRAALRLVELEQENARLRAEIAPTPPGVCPIDGETFEQPRTGQRRRYCSDRCRKAASRKRTRMGTSDRDSTKGAA